MARFSKTFFLSFLSLLAFITITLAYFQVNQGKLLNPKFLHSPPATMAFLPSPFTPLTNEEQQQDWGKELLIAKAFARNQDLYRAITCYKRAQILLSAKSERRLEAEYATLACYYMGKKYGDVITTFESNQETDILPSFPAYDDLLVILFDSYLQIGQKNNADKILSVIESRNPEQGKALRLYEAILQGDLETLSTHSTAFLRRYESEAKSVSVAHTLNAILPGAGYLYVGQKQTALTSFLINGLFIGGAYQFFRNGYVAVGLIAASLEMGWYLGGINGAGLAAQEYNERLYEAAGTDFLMQKRLFPSLMIKSSF